MAPKILLIIAILNLILLFSELSFNVLGVMFS